MAIYVRVSRLGQQPENQIIEQWHYVVAIGWEARECVSGAKDRRPALAALLMEVQRRIDVVVCWNWIASDAI